MHNPMQILILPILLPVIFIIPLIVSKSVRLSRFIGLAGSALLLAVSIVLFISVLKNGVHTLFLGGWEAPFGITLVADTTSAMMVLVSAFIAFTICIYSLFMVSDELVSSKFHVFFNSLMLGVNGALLTGDVFNLYVWFEVMLMSSFVLITLGNSKTQLEGGIKYMSMNLIGSLLFLVGLGLLYGKTGTLNMAHLATILIEDNNNLLMNTSAVLFFVAFGIKAAVFPLFFWLPASYHTANISITSLFA
jgi:multicomponent Na+:H+ antiporter subunit D